MTAEQQAQEAIAQAMDMQLWDIRLAGILNVIDTAKDHGGHRDWSADHARQIRELLQITDAVVVGNEEAVVPSGFGPLVRTEHTAKMLKTMAAAQAAREDGRAKGLRGSNTSLLNVDEVRDEHGRILKGKINDIDQQNG